MVKMSALYKNLHKKSTFYCLLKLIDWASSIKMRQRDTPKSETWYERNNSWNRNTNCQGEPFESHNNAQFWEKLNSVRPNFKEPDFKELNYYEELYYEDLKFIELIFEIFRSEISKGHIFKEKKFKKVEFEKAAFQTSKFAVNTIQREIF